MFSWSTDGADLEGQTGRRSGLSSVGVRFETPHDDGVNGSQENLTALKEELKQMRVELHALQEQADSDSITIGSIIFPSRAHCVIG